MFCSNCGKRTIEGNLFCVTCGKAQPSASSQNAVAGPVQGKTQEPAEEPIALTAVESPPPVNVTASAGVSATQLGAKPLYCRHSRFQRTALGVDREHGSEICLGCRLPYSPGSPGSGLGAAAPVTTGAGVKTDGPERPSQSLDVAKRRAVSNPVVVALISALVGGILGGILVSASGTSAMGPYEKGRSDGSAINTNHAQAGDVGTAAKSVQCDAAVGGVGFIQAYTTAETAEYVRGCMETVDGT
jgi:hypothetical protein